ncbi:MAG: acetylxylan esterase [bacterium]|nr:acetylxylan esterase [bacterium]MDD4153416.1 acetylxylan esterase [bacterium]
MPIIDMPLEQLMKYEGQNPCPADMDRFWDASLAEMRAIDPQVKMHPHDTGASFAECFDLYFTGVGGARIYAQYLRPKGAREPHPAVLLFHGYSGNSGDWTTKMHYVAQGFSVASMDCRGQGGKSEDVGGIKGNTLRGHIIRGLDESPEKLLFRNIYLDCAQLAGIVMNMPEVDPDRIGATGGSQGGGLTLACTALEPRIKLSAPIFPFLCDYLRIWEMDLDIGAYEELRTYFRHFDPLHEKEDEIFTRLGYIDNQHLAKRIRAEVMMTTGLMDTICPPSSQFAAYNKITSKKDLVIYPDFGHEGLPWSADKVFKFMCKL